jgi:phosphoesterase RecJ-like protein
MTPEPIVISIIEALQARDKFVFSSHARSDGDSIGSQLALATALRHLGKSVRIINRDVPPPHLQSFPTIGDIEVAPAVAGTYDAAVVLECSTLHRTEVAGLDRYFVINVDHHAGNEMYGALNWFDESATACGEMVFDLIKGLGVPLTPDIAIWLYVAILTDTGGFHHGNITARTFEICRQVVDAGVSAADVAARVYHTSSVGKLRLTGSVLGAMELAGNGRVAVLTVNDQLLNETECAPDDMEGLVNLPLTAANVEAVIFFKAFGADLRVSLRSKPGVDVRAVAAAHGGGGHSNAAGFSVDGALDLARARIVAQVVAAVDAVTHGEKRG